MKIVGYAEIKSNAVKITAASPYKFKGKVVRVYEFASDGGILVVDNSATELAMIEKEEIARSFKCNQEGNTLMPIGLDVTQKAGYQIKVQIRQGGYNDLLMKMVIAASLAKGQFDDNILFQNQ